MREQMQEGKNLRERIEGLEGQLGQPLTNGFGNGNGAYNMQSGYGKGYQNADHDVEEGQNRRGWVNEDGGGRRNGG